MSTFFSDTYLGSIIGVIALTLLSMLLGTCIIELAQLYDHSLFKNVRFDIAPIWSTGVTLFTGLMAITTLLVVGSAVNE